MTEAPVSSKRTLVGATILVVNPLLYLAIEAISAAAWTQPAYSYGANYISDLGVPDATEFQGRVVDSPLHVLMNTGFVLHGVLFVIACALLWRSLPGRRAQITFLGLAIVHGVGIALVGLFHGSTTAVADGTVVFHSTGAMMAIVGGNLAAIVAGASIRTRAPRLGLTLISCGILGISALIYLAFTAGSPLDGVPERLAVYTVMAAQISAGATLLLNHLRRRSVSPAR